MLIALVGGTVIHKLIAGIIDKFLCWVLGMRNMSTMDEFFLYDDENSLSNTCIVGNFTPFKFEEMSAYFKQSFRN